MPGLIRPIPLLAAAPVLLAAGCAASGARAGPSPVGAATPSCILTPAALTADSATSLEPGDLEVAIEHPVDPASAPDAADASARLVFRQLYETLVRIDCEGRARPGLAISWSHGPEGRRWSFTLRPDARFWDGTLVTAEAVARSWTIGDTADGGGGPGGRRAIAFVSVAGERELTVFLVRPSTTVATFARPALAVTGEGRFGSWPLGSGPYRPVPAGSLGPGGIRIASVGVGGRADSITFSVVGSVGARTALDRGVDVLVSDEPDVLAYARALPGFTTVPLPWSRTYVVAAADTTEAGEAPTPLIPRAALERLAQGAVQADARPAQPPFWWSGGACPAAGSTEGDTTLGRRTADDAPARQPPPSRIVFPAGDAVARSLAGRLVGLAGLGSATPAWLAEAIPDLGATRGPVVAAGLDAAALARAVLAGDALAFVVPVPRAPAGPCVSALLGDRDVVARAVVSPTSGLRITPLIDVRSFLVTRGGPTEIAVDGEGTLIFRPPEEGP